MLRLYGAHLGQNLFRKLKGDRPPFQWAAIPGVRHSRGPPSVRKMLNLKAKYTYKVLKNTV